MPCAPVFDGDGEALLMTAPYRWFRISPRRLQVWREVNQMPAES